MSKTRVYFDQDILPIVENIRQQTGLKSYTDVINWMVKKYGHHFIVTYNEFLTTPYLPKPQIDLSTNIELNNLESFRGL